MFTQKGIRCFRAALAVVISILALSDARAGEGRHALRSLPDRAQRIDAKVLYSIELAPGHKVTFYQFEGGDVGVNETLNLDRHQPVLSFLRESPTSLSGVFRLLRPRAHMPAALRLADRETSRVIRATEGGLPDKPAMRPMSRAICTEDGYWHSWECDAQWFNRNFCLPATTQYCYTNLTWVWQRRTGHEMNITGMAAGFDTSAHFVIQWHRCAWFSCSWETHVDTILPPRTYSHWYFPKHYQRYSRIDVVSGEARTHFAMTYNSDTATSTITSTGEQCSVWARVHAGLCYNADGSVSWASSHVLCADACASTYDRAVQFAKASLTSAGFWCDMQADQNWSYCGY